MSTRAWRARARAPRRVTNAKTSNIGWPKETVRTALGKSRRAHEPRGQHGVAQAAWRRRARPRRSPRPRSPARCAARPAGRARRSCRRVGSSVALARVVEHRAAPRRAARSSPAAARAARVRRSRRRSRRARSDARRARRRRSAAPPGPPRAAPSRTASATSTEFWPTRRTRTPGCSARNRSTTRITDPPRRPAEDARCGGAGQHLAHLEHGLARAVDRGQRRLGLGLQGAPRLGQVEPARGRARTAPRRARPRAGAPARTATAGPDAGRRQRPRTTRASAAATKYASCWSVIGFAYWILQTTQGYC